MCQPAWKRCSCSLAAQNIVKFAALILFLVPVCQAQITNLADTTSTPVPGAGHNYLGILNETVNPANGSVSLRIATPVPPGRKLTVPFSIDYDSSGTMVVPGASGLYWGGPGVPAWQYSVPTLSYSQVVITLPDGFGTCRVAYDYVYQDASGGRHPLYLSIYGYVRQSSNDCSTGYMPDGTPLANGETSTGGDTLVQAYTPAIPDGQRFTMQKVWVTDADGTVVTFTPPQLQGDWTIVPDTIEDRNGNVVTVNHSSPSTVFNSYTDTLGRSSVSISGTNPQTISVSGLSPYTANYGSISVSGLNLTINQYSGSCPVQGGGSGGPATLMTSLTLPNSKAYQFSYDPTSGGLSKIVYPTGGYVRYVWGVNSQSEAGEDSGTNSDGTNFSCAYYYDVPVVTDRYVSFDGSTEVLHQHFAYSTTWKTGYSQGQYSQKTTTVTTYDLVRGGNFQTVYTYSGVTAANQPLTGEGITNQMPVESQVQYYDWASNGGGLLKTVNKTWQFENQNEMMCESVTQGSVTSRTDYAYSSTMALVTDKKEWDWGTAPPCGSSTSGTPLRETVTNYNTFTTPIFAGGPSILDKPSQVTVYGSGTQIAQTTYAYTESVSSAGVTVGRDSNYNGNSGIARGNESSVTRWLNTGGASPVTTYAYDDTGQITSMIDPCGNTSCSDMAGSNHTTSYSYNNDNAYLATITYPNTGVAHTEGYSYNSSTGELASSTDENGKVTSYSYNDPFARLTETDYPDTGKTTLSYNDTAPTPNVTATKEMNSSQSVVSTTIANGIGLTTETELTSDPQGTDYTVTGYDGLGRTYTVTNPYRSTSDPTYGVTTYVYDALGRTTQITHPDGSKISTAYTGRATEVTDEGNGTKSVQRISQTDGLGRLTSVCEVSGATQLGTTPTPAACGQDISATGFLTSYAYDALGNLTGVTQGGLNSRTFGYDSLSRLASVTNPESGATSYTYDANGNLLTKADARSITTTYTYDALNRLLSKTYSDGTTPGANFTYDASSEWGVTLTNPIGRLTLESADNGHAMAIFSYDPMGRTANEWQCTPLNCGSGAFSLPYTYDLAGDDLTSSNGEGVTFTSTHNAAAQLTSMTSSFNDSNHPGTLFSNAAYNAPSQLTSDQLGNGVTETRAYNPRLWMTSLVAGSAYNLSMTSYAPNGDILAANDSANGNWNYAYDDFNRLCASNQGGQTSLTCTSTNNTGQQAYTYGYDRFSNR